MRRTLLSRIDGHGLWLNSLLFDVYPPSVCGIFRSAFFGSQVNCLYGVTMCYIVLWKRWTCLNKIFSRELVNRFQYGEGKLIPITDIEEISKRIAVHGKKTQFPQNLKMFRSIDRLYCVYSSNDQSVNLALVLWTC